MCGSDGWAKGESGFTACWNSWSHEFTLSREALSGARVKTSSADKRG